MFSLLKSLIYINLLTFAGLAVFCICANTQVSQTLKKAFAIVLLYCNFIVFISPNIIVHEIMSIFIVPLFARQRKQVLPIYLFAFLLMPAISYTLSAGGTYLFVFTNFISLSIGAYAALIMKGGSSKGKWTASATCVMLIMVVYLFAGLRGGSITNTMRVFAETALIILLPYLVVRRSIRSTFDAREMLIALAAACTILSVIAIYEANKTWPIYRIVYEHYGIVLGNEVQVKMRGGIMRATGTFIESTSFGLWLSFGAFVGLTGRWMFKSRIHHWIICGILLAGLFAPQSRGAWLGLVIAFMFFQIGKGRIGAMISGLVGSLTFGAFVYGIAHVIPQLGTMLGLDKTGTIGHDYRQDLFTRGIEEAQKNLLFGTDFNTVLEQLADIRQGEGIIDFVNTYLYLLLVSGAVGMIIFFFSLFVPITAMWRKAAKFRKLDTYPMSVIAALLGSLAIMLFFTFLSGRTTMGLGMLLGAAAALESMNASRIGEVFTKSGDTRRRVRIG